LSNVQNAMSIWRNLLSDIYKTNNLTATLYQGCIPL